MVPVQHMQSVTLNIENQPEGGTYGCHFHGKNIDEGNVDDDNNPLSVPTDSLRIGATE